jgi:hypothetical protein
MTKKGLDLVGEEEVCSGIGGSVPSIVYECQKKGFRLCVTKNISWFPARRLGRGWVMMKSIRGTFLYLDESDALQAISI